MNKKTKAILQNYGLKLFSLLCTLGALQIFIFGEMGRGIGDTVYRFDGLERLFGLIFLFWAWVFWTASDKDFSETKKDESQ